MYFLILDLYLITSVVIESYWKLYYDNPSRIIIDNLIKMTLCGDISEKETTDK